MSRLTKEEIGLLLPHGPSMWMLESVEHWDDTAISCRTATHRNRANPLRHRGCLSAFAGLEYAAQAMGVHVGLCRPAGRMDGSIGYVGSVREVACTVERLDDLTADLVVDAVRLAEGDRSYMYRFALTAGDRVVLSGRASIFLRPGII